MFIIFKRASLISIFSLLVFTSTNAFSQASEEIAPVSSNGIVEATGKHWIGIPRPSNTPHCENLGKHYTRKDKTAWNESLWDWCVAQGYKYALPTQLGYCRMKDRVHELTNCRTTAKSPGSNNDNGYFLNYEDVNPVYCCK